MNLNMSARDVLVPGSLWENRDSDDRLVFHILVLEESPDSEEFSRLRLRALEIHSNGHLRNVIWSPPSDLYALGCMGYRQLA